MTVTYTAQVASCKRFGCFYKLLFRWKGSIYKLLWPNLFLYAFLYTCLSYTYRAILNEEQKIIFEKLSLHCQTYGDLIPVSFVLGFYVSIVVTRWWDQYISIPWPDSLALFVSALVIGHDERGRLMRRTIMRYANLSLLITLRMMCPAVKKRFPTLDHIMDAGFLTPCEKKIFELMDKKTAHPTYWMPCVWATSVMTRARKEDRIKNDFAMKTLIDEVNRFRGCCGGILNYDWISIPLVYTQVVTLAVYTFFLATLMGNQYLDPSKGYPGHQIDLVVPIFTVLQFFFYMGWLLVAETLVNPFGEDDDDFDVNWLIDRNLQTSYVIVDEMHQEHPQLVRDQYWDEVFPAELPYTAAANNLMSTPFLGSAVDVEVPIGQSGFMRMDCYVAEEATHINFEDENQFLNVERHETVPVLIKKHDTVVGDTASSGARVIKDNSVITMLKRNFHRADSQRSIAGSIGSEYNRRYNQNISLAQSPNSMIRASITDVGFQEEVFLMSDTSLDGSVDSPQISFSGPSTMSRVLLSILPPKRSQSIKPKQDESDRASQNKMARSVRKWKRPIVRRKQHNKNSSPRAEDLFSDESNSEPNSPMLPQVSIDNCRDEHIKVGSPAWANCSESNQPEQMGTLHETIPHPVSTPESPSPQRMCFSFSTADEGGSATPEASEDYILMLLPPVECNNVPEENIRLQSVDIAQQDHLAKTPPMSASHPLNSTSSDATLTPPFTPSAAIDIPSHSTQPMPHDSKNSLRALHDFHELEPILEQAELTAVVCKSELLEQKLDAILHM